MDLNFRLSPSLSYDDDEAAVNVGMHASVWLAFSLPLHTYSSEILGSNVILLDTYETYVPYSTLLTYIQYGVSSQRQAVIQNLKPLQ